MSTTQKSAPTKETLLSIATDLETVIDGGMVIDEETGEVLFDSENLDALQVTAAQKFLATDAYRYKQRAIADDMRDMAKKMHMYYMCRAKAAERKAERMDWYMLNCARAAGGEIATDTITVKVSKCPPSVEVLGEADIPEAYWNENVTRSIDKKAIREAIKAGEYVPGAALVQREKVTVK